MIFEKLKVEANGHNAQLYLANTHICVSFLKLFERSDVVLSAMGTHGLV